MIEVEKKTKGGEKDSSGFKDVIKAICFVNIVGGSAQ